MGSLWVNDFDFISIQGIANAVLHTNYVDSYIF